MSGAQETRSAPKYHGRTSLQNHRQRGRTDDLKNQYSSLDFFEYIGTGDRYYEPLILRSFFFSVVDYLSRNPDDIIMKANIPPC